MLTFSTLSRTAVFLTALSACVDSGSSCKTPDTRDEVRELRTVNRLIADTREGMARGYREVDGYGSGGGFVNLCLGGISNNVGVSVCGDPSRRSRAVPVDMTSEERKLKALETRRNALQSEINAKNAACTGAKTGAL